MVLKSVRLSDTYIVIGVLLTQLLGEGGHVAANGELGATIGHQVDQSKESSAGR